MKLFLPLLALMSLGALEAQQFEVGVKGGIRTTDEISGTGIESIESKRYIVGPTVELRLPAHVGIEVDALYRRVGFTSAYGSPFGSSITRTRANSWEIPVIAKYHFPTHLMSPFAGVGYAPRIVHGSEISSGGYLSDVPTSTYTYYFNSRGNTSYPVTHGVVVTGGTTFSAGHLRISPEVRYVHWNSPLFDNEGSYGYSLKASQNEVFVMVGITWH